jgi:hypothetical protein
VALNATFFANSPVRQATTLVPEALHIAGQVSEDAMLRHFGNSGSVSGWLFGDCPRPRKQ